MTEIEALDMLVASVCLGEFGHWRFCPYDVDALAEIVDGIGQGVSGVRADVRNTDYVIRRLSGLFCDLVADTCTAAFIPLSERARFTGGHSLRVLAIAAERVPLDLALLLWLIVAWLLMRSTPYAVDKKFRVLQLGSAALYSIGHGANDAQKTMGIIASLLFAEGLLGPDFYVPLWVVLSCQVAMALGTLIGGWRIVKTMGSRITRLKPVQGFCAETAGAMTLYLATSFGVPVSTTHTITGAIMGVGAARRVSAVRWGIAGSIIIAWVVTLPAAALIGALFYAFAAQF